MKHLDLFSGIGGFALAAQRVGWETVGFCDNDPYCQEVLRERFPGVPIYDDVRTLDGRAVGSVGIVTGGYPCQPFSLAGKRGGANDDRHLWPAMCRIIEELRPAWVVGENVAGHISMGLDDVLSDLERIGYACRPFAIPAVAVDARHRRERLWIVANAASDQDRRVLEPELQPDSRASREPSMADAAEFRPQGSGNGYADDSETHGLRGSELAGGGSGSAAREWCSWLSEPSVGRVAHGIPARVDRLRALGNAIVPQVAEEIFRAIKLVSSASNPPNQE